MKKKMITKAMSYLLAVTMLVGSINLSKLAAVEVKAETGTETRNVNLNVNNSIAGIGNPSTSATDKWTGSRVYLGNREWRVLDSDHASTGAAGQAFLFSETFFVSEYYNTPDDDSNPWPPITWEECTLRKVLNGTDNAGGFYASTFANSIEKAAIITSHIETPNNHYNLGINIPGGNPTDDKLFLLSLNEVQNNSYGFNNNETRGDKDGNNMSSSGFPIWWLRSPGSETNNVAYVNNDGRISAGGGYATGHRGVRPALNLDLSSVLFSSASGTDKATSFGATTTSEANEWRLTLAGGAGFTAARAAGETGSVKAGDKMHVDVSNVGTVTAGSGVSYTQLSAMLVDADETVAAYGKIKDGAAEDNNLEVTIPSDIIVGDYTLKVFAEQVNTGNATDYASNMVNIPITIGNPSPNPSPNEQKDDNNKNTEGAGTKKSENTYVNPLSWTYAGTKADSLCTIEQQGKACQAIFKANMPAGYTEGFSFNLSTKENGVMKTSYAKKTGKLVLYLPKEYQKSGRTTALLGIDKSGTVRLFADEDTNDSTITVSLNNIEGYAFSFLYTDTGTGNIYTVKSGDVLSRIAENLKVSRKYLIDKNNLTNPNKLKIGQRLAY